MDDVTTQSQDGQCDEDLNTSNGELPSRSDENIGVGGSRRGNGDVGDGGVGNGLLRLLILLLKRDALRLGGNLLVLLRHVDGAAPHCVWWHLFSWFRSSFFLLQVRRVAIDTRLTVDQRAQEEKTDNTRSHRLQMSWGGRKRERDKESRLFSSRRWQQATPLLSGTRRGAFFGPRRRRGRGLPGYCTMPYLQVD